jgi:hypothetical protein
MKAEPGWYPGDAARTPTVLDDAARPDFMKQNARYVKIEGARQIFKRIRRDGKGR